MTGVFCATGAFCVTGGATSTRMDCQGIVAAATPSATPTRAVSATFPGDLADAGAGAGATGAGAFAGAAGAAAVFFEDATRGVGTIERVFGTGNGGGRVPRPERRITRSTDASASPDAYGLSCSASSATVLVRP